jgi:hypothetical protein
MRERSGGENGVLEELIRMRLDHVMPRPRDGRYLVVPWRYKHALKEMTIPTLRECIMSQVEH